MRLTISKKLILSFLGLTTLILIATLGLARWSFERGFLDYVNALEEVRLEKISKALSQHYVDSGNNWEALTRKDFGDFLRNSPPEHPTRLRSSTSTSRENPTRPHLNSPPPPDFQLDPDEMGQMSETSPKPRRPPPRSNRRIPTALFDVSNKRIIGPSFEDKRQLISVLVLVGDEVVGVLKSSPRRRFESPQETSFSKQQFTTSALIALFSLCLAVIASWLLTRALLSPVQRMIRGVSKLTSGDYTSRLGEKRKDELGDLMNNLDHLAIRLDENKSSRQRWLADISHELRTPITVLTGEIETLKDGIRPFNQEQLASLDQEVERLRHLVDDLYELSISDIGGLRYSFKPTNLKEMLASSVDSTEYRAKEVGINVQLLGNNKDLISGDEQRLNQLFTNLISNSLTYTDAPGKLNIEMSSNNDYIIFHFQDSAPGATLEECQKLFDPLYRQEKSRSRRTAGAGLGLAICKNIVEAHQGKIIATPSDLGGICIEITFPIKRD